MSHGKLQAKHEFTRWSESYDRSILQRVLFAPSHRAIIARIRSRCDDQPLRILDIGCGTGIFAERIREAFPSAQIVGIDLVEGMLSKGAERWKRHATSVLAVQADSERLPFDRSTFDIVTCANSFHHYPHQQRAIAEMRRVLRPHGRLMLVDGFRDRPYGWFIYDVCVATLEGSVHHASSDEMRTMCEAAGFESAGQTIHRGLAPFLLTEAMVSPASQSSPAARGAMTAANR